MLGRALAVGPASLLLVASVLASVPAPAEPVRSGSVYVDADGDGTRDPGEPGRAGVAVTNGRRVVSTDADGRYEIPAGPHGFVALSCPADARCPVWYRRSPPGQPAPGPDDFAIVPAAPAGDFFFVQLSDSHVYPSVEDMRELMGPLLGAWYLPRLLVGWGMLWQLDRMYPDHDWDDIAGALRAVVARHRGVEGKWDATIMMDYVELALDPRTGIVEPEIEIPHAFGEVAALRPAFAIHTGDMILEGNHGEPEAVERWLRYYRQVIEDEGLAVYETIGNNELAGTSNGSFAPSDPRYGKALFRRHFGPTHYSFDYGDFHFVALDTHAPLFSLDDPDPDEEWSFETMEDDVRDWLDADLAAARAAGRRLVVLNHEPFFEDPAWDFDDFEPADDQGLLAKHGVAYTLSGHVHRNGFRDAPAAGGVTHIVTGALSGLRWTLPVSIDSRGYRLFYARDGRLHSAWKDVDAPLLGFVSPRGDPRIHPASTHAPEPRAVAGTLDVVAVGVDVDRPYARLELALDGERLASEPWGDYFVHARFDAARIRGAGRLELVATTHDGETRVERMELLPAPPAPGD